MLARMGFVILLNALLYLLLAGAIVLIAAQFGQTWPYWPTFFALHVIHILANGGIKITWKGEHN